jgi:hypothetical protein
MKTIVALLMITMSGMAAGQINKCVDKSGKAVAYGNAGECPAGSRAEQMAIKPAPAQAPAATPGAAPAATPGQAPAQKSLADREADFRKRQVEKQEAEAKAQKTTADTERRRQACEQNQGYLKSLQSGQRIATTDPKTGERSYLSDSDYAGELARARQAVEASCK